MRAFLARRWFLLLLAGGGTLAVALPASAAWTGAVDPRGVVALALFLMSFTLPGRSLVGALARPWPALWAVVISYGLLPPLALLVGTLLSPDFRVGLLISASVPCTLASAVVWTRRAGGDDATALLVILLTTGASWLVTPTWLALGTGADIRFDVLRMMLDLLLTLVLPVGLGQACQLVPRLAALARQYRTPLGVVAQLLILAILFKAAGYVGERLAQGTAAPPALAVLGIAVVAVLVHLAALGCGLWGSNAWGFDRPQRVAVAFACSQKTLPVGMLLFERYFQAAYPLAVLPLAFYHFGQLIVDTFIADALAARGAAEEEMPPPVDV